MSEPENRSALTEEEKKNSEEYVKQEINGVMKLLETARDSRREERPTYLSKLLRKAEGIKRKSPLQAVRDAEIKVMMDDLDEKGIGRMPYEERINKKGGIVFEARAISKQLADMKKRWGITKMPSGSQDR